MRSQTGLKVKVAIVMGYCRYDISSRRDCVRIADVKRQLNVKKLSVARYNLASLSNQCLRSTWPLQVGFES